MFPRAPTPLCARTSNRCSGRKARLIEAVPATKKCAERKSMVSARLARAFSFFQDLLHGFKQLRRNQWLKISIKPFAAMFDEAEIRSMCEKSFDGNFGKWRSV